MLGIVISVLTYYFPHNGDTYAVTERFYNLVDMRSRLSGFNAAYLDSIDDFEKKVNQIKSDHPASQGDDWRYAFELKVLGHESGGIDLNGDGVPELYFDFPLACGSGGCMHDILSFNSRTQVMEYIGQFSTRRFEVLGNPINGWAPIKETTRMGACEEIITHYVFRDAEYRPESSHSEVYC